jgi:hypothetical protein
MVGQEVISLALFKGIVFKKEKYKLAVWKPFSLHKPSFVFKRKTVKVRVFLPLSSVKI